MHSQVETGVSISAESTILLDHEVVIRPGAFIGAYFVDANGDQVQPTAGTVSFKSETINVPGSFQSVPSGTEMDCTSPLRTLMAAGNSTRIKITPSSISGNGVDSMVVTVTANEAQAHSMSDYGFSGLVVDLSADSTDVTEGPALVRSVYVNTSLSAHPVVIKDGTTPMFTLPANTPSGSELMFCDTLFKIKVVVDPDDAATGSITVIYKEV